MVSAQHACRRAERVLLAQHGVGNPHRRVGDPVAVDHVAEIDDAGDARLVIGRDQHVVEVVVVVDHLRPQRSQAGQHMLGEARHERPRQCAPWPFRQAAQLHRQAVRGRHVPQQLVRGRRVREALQGEV